MLNGKHEIDGSETEDNPFDKLALKPKDQRKTYEELFMQKKEELDAKLFYTDNEIQTDLSGKPVIFRLGQTN